MIFDRLKWVAVFATLLLLPVVSTAQEQATVDASGVKTAGDTSFIYQTVAVPFRPLQVFLLVEASPGRVLQFSGQSVARYPEEEDKADRMLVAAELPLEILSKKSDAFYHTFFLVGENTQFAATPVRKWKKELFLAEESNPKAYDKKLEMLSKELKDQKDAEAALEKEFSMLREDASKIAGVSEIIDLKTRLTSLKGFEKDQTAEALRLKTLVEHGHDLKDPSGINAHYQELSVQLEEMAKATAMADRLNVRRREAARSTLKTKLDLIKRYKTIDTEALAQEVLRLRARRRSLERRAQQQSGVSESDEF